MQNPSTDVFDDFDDEQGQNLLGSLQLETDDEPVRRGASRANSVRFDVSALQGSNWAQGSRNSGEFGPIRPSSGIGSHLMTERSLSHKSDGRHSSAGHSVHSVHSVPSGRTSSLGLDTNFIIGGQDDEDSPLDIPEPPPGLFILGSVPSIIRCWLTTDFSHGSLLYGAVCTGSQRSVLDYSLIKELGLVEQIQKRRNGHNTIRLPVYLPEAVITQPSSRSNSPAPQLPTLTSDFEIVGLSQRGNSDRKFGIRVFLGSDTLRAHNADILFSQNLMTLYGDDRNKLSVPFVRPEDEAMFKNLCTANIPPEKIELKATAAPFAPTESNSTAESGLATGSPRLKGESGQDNLNLSKLPGLIQRSAKSADQSLSPASVDTTMDFTSLDQAIEAKPGPSGLNGNTSGSEKHSSTTAPTNESPEENSSADPARRESSGGIWGSWRQGTASNASDNGDSISGYQRAARGGRNMKVLKSSKSITASVPSRSSSSARVGTAYEPAPSRPSGELRRKSQVGGTENVPLRWESKKTTGDEQKVPKAIATVPRSSNPIGGASAFAWMNTGKSKVSATTTE
jgi:hypothetical protein